MGLIGRLFRGLFGGGRNVVAETAEVFRVNAEANAQRNADFDQAALAQFAAEFRGAQRGLFDRVMDGLNRFPRPMIVISIFWLFSLVVFDPVYFAQIMTALDLVPTPLWYAAGTLMTFYFGGRMQIKMLEARREFGTVAERLPDALAQIQTLRSLSHDTPGAADAGTDVALSESAVTTSDNPAIQEWLRKGEAQ